MKVLAVIALFVVAFAQDQLTLKCLQNPDLVKACETTRGAFTLPPCTNLSRFDINCCRICECSTNLPTCSEATVFRNDTTGCPACKKTACTECVKKDCLPDQKPVFDGCCYSCTLNQTICRELTEQQKQACLTNIPVCAANEKPVLTTSCCPSCNLPVVQCTDAQIFNCKNEIYSKLPPCAEGKLPQWNSTRCCYNCRTATAVEQCTDEKRKLCLENLRECDINEGEKQQLYEGQCCASCRPISNCSISDFLACQVSTPTCSNGTVAFKVVGKCCPSCVPPKCGITCPDQSACITKTGDGGNYKFVCVPRRKIVKKILLSGGLKGLPNTKYGELVKEVVRKFCSTPSLKFRAQCNNQTRLEEFLSSVGVTVEVNNVTIEQEDDVQLNDIVVSALQDPVSSESGFLIEEVAATDNNNSTSSGNVAFNILVLGSIAVFSWIVL